MIKIILIIIILSIIIEHLLSANQINKDLNSELNPNEYFSSNDSNDSNEYNELNDLNSKEIIKLNNHKELKKKNNKNNKSKNIIFDNPNPWSRIIFNPNNKYSYTFYIKIEIPSFNDYHTWKKIIQTLDYLPNSKELIILANDEETAIGIINLIIMTFTNNISFDNIIEKNLINLSIEKIKQNTEIKETFREQINKYLHYQQNSHLKENVNIQSSNEYKLNNNKESNNKESNNKEFNNKLNNDIEAYDGGDYSYL